MKLKEQIESIINRNEKMEIQQAAANGGYPIDKTSLILRTIKQAVAEAKPKPDYGEENGHEMAGGWNVAIDEYEKALLKMLE